MPRWPENYKARVKQTCPQCGKRKDYYAELCRKCTTPGKHLSGRTGANHPAWRGGRRIDRDGYVKLYLPAHPWPRRAGYVFEHVAVMELSIGRRLSSTEVVHHKNHDKKDNRLENLQLMSAGEHSSHHRKLNGARERNSSGRFRKKEVPNAS